MRVGDKGSIPRGHGFDRGVGGISSMGCGERRYPEMMGWFTGISVLGERRGPSSRVQGAVRCLRNRNLGFGLIPCVWYLDPRGMFLCAFSAGSQWERWATTADLPGSGLFLKDHMNHKIGAIYRSRLQFQYQLIHIYIYIYVYIYIHTYSTGSPIQCMDQQLFYVWALKSYEGPLVLLFLNALASTLWKPSGQPPHLPKKPCISVYSNERTLDLFGFAIWSLWKVGTFLSPWWLENRDPSSSGWGRGLFTNLAPYLVLHASAWLL